MTECGIDTVLQRADLQEHFFPMSGDCLNVAFALQKHYDGKIFGIFPKSSNYPSHVFIVTRSGIYDGCGKILKHHFDEITPSEYSIRRISDPEESVLFNPERAKDICRHLTVSIKYNS